MISFPIDMKLAAKAAKLAATGLKGKAMSLVLGTKRAPVTTEEANLLASVGYAAKREADCQLTERETSILLALAAIQRERLARGETGSPKGKHVAWRLRLSEGQVRRATLRIRTRHDGEPFQAFRLDLLEHSVNGHIWMLPAGWAVVHAVEAAKAAKSAAVQKAFIAYVAKVSAALSFQAGVGGRETAGAIISYLAKHPDKLDAFMEEGWFGLGDDPRDVLTGGMLSWHGMDGKVWTPEEALAAQQAKEAARG